MLYGVSHDYFQTRILRKEFHEIPSTFLIFHTSNTILQASRNGIHPFFNASFNANSSLCVRHQTNPTHGVSWRTIVISLFFTPVLTETLFEPRNTTLDNKYSKFAYLKADLWLNKCLAHPAMVHLSVQKMLLLP